MAELNITLPDHLIETIMDVAKQLDITIDDAVRRAIEGYYIDNAPADLVAADLRAALDEVRNGNTYPIADILAGLPDEQPVNADKRP